MADVPRIDNLRIYKYEIPIDDYVLIDMPEVVEYLCVQVQNNKPYLWAMVKTKSYVQTRGFFVVGTGHPMPKDAGDYLGTFQLHNGGLVFHVFKEAGA